MGGRRKAGFAWAGECPVMRWAGGVRACEGEADVDVVGLGGGEDEGRGRFAGWVRALKR